jgi:hypothetical protein
MTTINVPTFAPTEPVEVRLTRRSNRVDQAPVPPYVLSAWVTPSGMIDYSLTIGGAGMPESLSNLQSKATFPRKAVPGWQAEVIAFAAAGLYTIGEVR